MPTTNTNNKSKVKSHPSASLGAGKSKVRIQDFWLSALVFILAIFAVYLLSHRLPLRAEWEKAEDYLRQSADYYARAINEYKGLIAQGRDLDRLYYALGKLYYEHGEFEPAIEALKKSHDIKAKKFLAISYYRLSNFTDALEIFGRQRVPDDEYLYYHGLTCEKLNLFDQALNIYRDIRDPGFKNKAMERLNAIEKETRFGHLRHIEPAIQKIMLQAPSAQKYPQAGALILYCDEKTEITPKDTEITTLHYIVKILNERGKEDFSETQIEYDSTYEKVELEYARTIKPNGEVVDVGSRHIRDVSKYLNFPLYSNVRVYIISFPEITEGAIIEYKAKAYRNELMNKKDFVLTYPVQGSEPIIAANFTLSVPKDRTANIKLINQAYNDFGANLNPDIKEEDGRLIYNWQFKDIPQIIPESNMPPNVEINPAILISSFSNWQDIYNWWWGLSQDKIKIDTAIKEKVRQLIKKGLSAEARIRAIYNFCAQKIRYVAVEYGRAGYQPHQAGDIFKNKYGDCKDQAILLITMLREAGFTAWPVLIATKGHYNLTEEFPSVLFNHCIAAVLVKDKIVFLDPTAETCPFGDLPGGDQARRVLVFCEDKYKIEDTPLYPAEHNSMKHRFKIQVDKDEGILAQKSVSASGVYEQAQRAWLLYTPPQLVEEALKEAIQATSIGATLERYEIKNLNDLNAPVIFNYGFKGPEYFTQAGKLRIPPQLTGLDSAMVAKYRRKYPLDFNLLDTKENLFEIEIPDNFAIKYIPETVIEESPWLKFVCAYTREGNKVYAQQKTALKKNTVSVEEYPDFKKFIEGLAKRTKQRMVLEKIR